MARKKEIQNNPFAGQSQDAFSRFSSMPQKEEGKPTQESTIQKVAEQASNRKTMADTHTRATFIVENDLLDRWNALLDSKSEKRIKNKVFNQMLREFLDKEEASMNEN